MTNKGMRALALGLALAVGMPAFAAGDAQDTVTEKKAQAKKKLRDMKPGDKTAQDRVEDAKDTATEKKAQGKKKARKARRAVKHKMDEATK